MPGPTYLGAKTLQQPDAVMPSPGKLAYHPLPDMLDIQLELEAQPADTPDLAAQTISRLLVKGGAIAVRNEFTTVQGKPMRLRNRALSTFVLKCLDMNEEEIADITGVSPREVHQQTTRLYNWLLPPSSITRDRSLAPSILAGLQRGLLSVEQAPQPALDPEWSVILRGLVLPFAEGATDNELESQYGWGARGVTYRFRTLKRLLNLRKAAVVLVGLAQYPADCLNMSEFNLHDIYHK